ncbi:hypothetical protein STRIP9103_02619 [Streptomyces ipomoeae 91-03]|uniref:Uncharacterized protein n=1 Tax=Streptomyces ipomoeae 91-03 TaxID=698759 RepID=L1KIL4_9ACTN|nr:hypothetical protein STRIP9103_02619 [Streptomyces ipomoeae 91-03]
MGHGSHVTPLLLSLARLGHRLITCPRDREPFPRSWHMSTPPVRLCPRPHPVSLDPAATSTFLLVACGSESWPRPSG